jgi:hypothetical protein
MSNVARLRIDEPPQVSSSSPAATFLGPGEVLAVGPLGVEVALADGRRMDARLALAFAWEPAVGDTALVIAQEEAYVIGVLASRGKGTLAFPGDLELRAVGGSLTLAADQGVAISGRTLQVNVGKLEMVARAVTQRFDSLRQRVTDLLHVHAGESHTVVEGSSHLRAKSASILSEEKVSINGKAIHLG